LNKLLDKFARSRVLLVGDVIVDLYTYGSAMGLSAETPTIVSRFKEVRRTLGGAAFVCRNLLELGAQVDFVTLTGRDEEGARIRDWKAPNLNLGGVTDETRNTTVKHRFWVDGYKLFQLDTRNDEPISPALVDAAMAQVKTLAPKADCIVISDYRHGFLTPEFVKQLIALAAALGKRVYVDSQVSQTISNHHLYQPDAVICLNVKEARCIDPNFAPSPTPQAFAALRKVLNTGNIVVKMGEMGAMMLSGGRVVEAPARKVEVVDTIGAGDAFLAAFCLGGLDDPAAALAVANAWAGLSVGVHGTTPPRRAALAEQLEQVSA
jgi:D-beta-D-heptose 7-phosphate kinase / D-beta-D-heptose 1-phosphate adenosyltransferase